jgi:hypothetical protein
MRKTLLALTAIAALGIGAFAAAPASAAPFATTKYGAHYAGQAQQAHYRHRPHVRRHFWTPWRYAHRHCYPIRHGFVCYY